MDFKDYYNILEIEEYSDEEDIRKAYRKLARKYHPDVNPNDEKVALRFREINEAQKRAVIKKIESSLWILKDKAVAVLGLSFKPDTDDIRYAPSIDIVRMLLDEGVSVRVFDPQAMKKAKRALKSKKIMFARDPYHAITGADCLLLMTEWEQFRNLDYKKIKTLLKQPLVVDGRNMCEPKVMKKLGFNYIGVGR